MSVDHKIFAVLTGDIVGSTDPDAPAAGALLDTLRQLETALGECYGDAVVGHLDVFRGDGWQLLVSKPDWSLRIAVFMRVFLKSKLGVDTRVAIAIGHVETIDRAKISTSSGPAFLSSGRYLDQEMGSRRMAMADGVQPDNMHRWLAVLLKLFDDIVTGLSRAQADAILHMLEAPDLTQEDLGEQLSISQEAARKRLKSGRWTDFQSVIELFESVTAPLVDT